MAWQDYSQPITVMERKVVSDGMGGYEVAWNEGIQFKGTLNTSGSVQRMLAEQQGVTAIYVLLYPDNLPLQYGDILKVDNRYFRIATDPKDGTPPTQSTFDFIQVNLEKYDIEKVV